jgi:hypothetical protein
MRGSDGRPTGRLAGKLLKAFGPGLALVSASATLAAPARGQQVGVLIGVVEARAESEAAQGFDSIHEAKYQTLWIAQDAHGQFNVAATIAELIVPRRDGFWHVGVKQVCEFDEGTGEDGGNENIRQAIWAAPVAKAGEVQQQHPCTAHKPEDYAPPFGRGPEDAKKISQCGFTLADIEFLSAELISWREYDSQSEDCEARGGRYSARYHVRRQDSNQAVSFGELLGAQASAAYAKAALAKPHGDDGEECGEAGSGKDDEWRIARNAGRWSAFVNQNMGYFGCSVDAPIRFRLPGALTGEPAVLLDGKAFSGVEKEIQDLFVSPAGDLAMLATKTEIKFYEVREKVPGKLLLSLPGRPIVLVQWATGTHVQDWTGQLKKMAGGPLPEPVLRVEAASK